MSTLPWRKLVRGTASVLLAAGISGPVLADEAGEEGVPYTPQTEAQADAAGTSDLPGLILGDVFATDLEPTPYVDEAVQIAQGVTTYERRRRLLDRPGRGDSVRGRARPQFDPLGVRLGAFVLLPTLAVQEQYETNIFAQQNNEEDDFLTRILPNVVLRSDWNNHLLQFEGGGDVGRYADNSDENYEDYFIGASGRLDILRTTALSLRTRYRRLHESRESPDDVGAGAADEPTELDSYSANAALSHDFGRFNATLGGSFLRLHFDDPDAVGGGSVVEHDRDRNVYTGSLRLGYEIVPAYEAFILGAYNVRDYDGTENGTGVDRDSHGIALSLGMDVDFGGIIFGEFFAGIRRQEYDDPTLSSLTGFGGGADITWNVTGLTTITGTLTGDIRETTQAGASGRLVSRGELGVDHELRRNVILGATANLARDDYEGINRTDYIYGGTASALYLINRYLRGAFEYEFRQRDGDASNNDFTNHVFMLRLALQY